jgi:uncharacterized membrane protein YphA (DoxX/SURF4 family)
MALKSVANTQVDTGLLVLRGAALFLLFTFGLGKFVGLVQLLRSGDPLASSPFAVQIRDAVGFPAPGLAVVWVSVSESIAALFIACGFLTRLAAACATLSFVGALYFSLKIGEEPLRAAIYLAIFASLIFTGAGKFSIDYLLKSRTAPKAF